MSSGAAAAHWEASWDAAAQLYRDIATDATPQDCSPVDAAAYRLRVAIAERAAAAVAVEMTRRVLPPQ